MSLSSSIGVVGRRNPAPPVCSADVAGVSPVCAGFTTGRHSGVYYAVARGNGADQKFVSYFTSESQARTVFTDLLDAVDRGEIHALDTSIVATRFEPDPGLLWRTASTIIAHEQAAEQQAEQKWDDDGGYWD